MGGCINGDQLGLPYHSQQSCHQCIHEPVDPLAEKKGALRSPRNEVISSSPQWPKFGIRLKHFGITSFWGDLKITSDFIVWHALIFQFNKPLAVDGDSTATPFVIDAVKLLCDHIAIHFYVLLSLDPYSWERTMTMTILIALFVIINYWAWLRFESCNYRCSHLSVSWCSKGSTKIVIVWGQQPAIASRCVMMKNL